MENNRPFKITGLSLKSQGPHNVNLYVPAIYSDLSSGLRPTWQSYAGLPPEEGAYVTGFTFF